MGKEAVDAVEAYVVCNNPHCYFPRVKNLIESDVWLFQPPPILKTADFVESSSFNIQTGIVAAVVKALAIAVIT